MNEVFESNPKLKHYFKTADDQAFYNADDAKNHSKSLQDKSVETVFNPNLIDVADATEISDLDKEMSDFEIAENEAKLQKLEADANEAEPVKEVEPALAPLKVVKDATNKSK